MMLPQTISSFTGVFQLQIKHCEGLLEAGQTFEYSDWELLRNLKKGYKSSNTSKNDPLLVRYRSILSKFDAYHDYRDLKADFRKRKVVQLKNIFSDTLPPDYSEKAETFLHFILKGVTRHFNKKMTAQEAVNALKEELTSHDTGHKIKYVWEHVHIKMWKSCLPCQPLLNRYKLDSKRLDFLTGTRSPALLGIRRVVGTCLTNKPALIPTGILLKHNIPPLCGEMGCIGFNGVNRKGLSIVNISSMESAKDYAEKKEDYIYKKEKEWKSLEQAYGKYPSDPEGSERLLVSDAHLKLNVLRLLVMGEDPDRIKAKLKEILSHYTEDGPSICLNWQTLAPLIGTSTENLKQTENSPKTVCRGMIAGIPRSYEGNKLGMIYFIGQKGANFICEQKGSTKFVEFSKIRYFENEVLEKAARTLPAISPDLLDDYSELMMSEKELLLELVTLCDKVKKWNLSEEEKKEIEETYPIIFGSSTLHGEYVKSDVQGEKVFRGIAKLGDDIKVAFTKKKYVERLKAAVNSLGVAVLTFRSLRYLQIKQAILSV